MPLTPLTWKEQDIVNITTANAQLDPDVIQLANGNMLVSWTTTDAGGLGAPNGTETFAQIFDPQGNRIGAEIRLNEASTADDEQNADLAALPNGGFIVVYHDVDNPPSSPTGASTIRLEEYDAGGNPVSDDSVVLSDSGAGADPNFRNPRVAVSSGASVLVIYEQFTSSATSVVGKLYNPTTNTYGAQIDLLTGLGAISAVPDVVALTNGNYAVSATYNVSGDNAIAYRVISSAGANVVSQTFVTGTNTGGGNDREAALSALAGGGFVISWTNTEAGDTDVLFRVYNSAGVQVGSGSPGDTGGANNNNESKVITLADGTFVIAWDQDATTGLQVQHYSAAGAALGSVFTVAAENVNNISGVSLGDGRFALVWDLGSGEITMEILDTRDAANSVAVYTTPTFVGVVAGESLYGTAAAEAFYSGPGNDVVVAAGGADTIELGDGQDYSYSGDGNDSVGGGAGIDVLIGEAGDDTMYGGADQDYLFGGNDTDTLYGDAGVDVLHGEAGNDNLFGGAGIDYFYASVGADTATGGDDGDIFIMEGGNDFAYGEAGNDFVYAGADNDSIYGGAGIDVILGEAGNDFVDGGTDVDYVFLGTGDDTFFMDAFVAGLNVDVLHEFTPGAGSGDVLRLLNTGWTTIAQVNAAMFNTGNGYSILTLDPDSQIWLIGILPGQLVDGDVAFI